MHENLFCEHAYQQRRIKSQIHIGSKRQSIFPTLTSFIKKFSTPAPLEILYLTFPKHRKKWSAGPTSVIHAKTEGKLEGRSVAKDSKHNDGSLDGLTTEGLLTAKQLTSSNRGPHFNSSIILEWIADSKAFLNPL